MTGGVTLADTLGVLDRLYDPRWAQEWDAVGLVTGDPEQPVRRVLLADAAQEVNGKLYVLGGGWSVTGPDLPPMAIAIKLDVPWSDANTQHTFSLELVDQDGRPVAAGDSGGVRAEGTFEVGRPVGLPAGSDIDFAFVVSIPPFPISPGRFTWKLSIDGESHLDWVRPFQVRDQA